MKLKRKYFLSILCTPSTVLPTAVMSSCSTGKTLDFYNVSHASTGSFFGIIRNFDSSTNYNYEAKLESWRFDFGKPKYPQWNSVKQSTFSFSKADKTPLVWKNTSELKVICDGIELKRGTKVEYELGTCDWFYVNDFESNDIIQSVVIRNFASNPIKFISTVILQNVQYETQSDEVLCSFSMTLLNQNHY